MIVAPVNLKLPDNPRLHGGGKARPSNRLFLYFPNPRVSPGIGHQLAGGLYSMSYAEFENLSIEFPESLGAFQFLLVLKTGDKDEWVSDVHWDGERFSFAPFVSASWSAKGRAIEVHAAVLSGEDDCMFEITGVPSKARLSRGALVEDDVWQLGPKEAEMFKVEFPASATQQKFTLGIIAQNERRPELASHFNLMVNLAPPPKKFMRSYKEAVVDTAALVKEIAPRCRRYILSATGDVGGFCIQEGVRAGSKWIIDPGAKKLTLRIYDTDLERFHLRLHFIFEMKGSKYVAATRSMEMNLSDMVAHARDYSKCIGCRSRHACPMFNGFMDYAGHKTILRQII